MAVAGTIAQRGTCERAKVGVVIAREGRILVTGYNGAPSGLPHCNHTPEEIADPHGHCRIAVHAEANAIAWAARHGVALDGASLYTTVAPCLACAQLIVNAGIDEVIWLHSYPNTDGLDLLKQAVLTLVSYHELNEA